jgi:integral membrane protein
MAALMDRSFSRYRVMAYVVGTMLVVLCVIALPLQYAFGHPLFAEVGFDVHGIVYLVYLGTVADLARRAQFGPRRILAMVAAGFVPGLAFFEERRVAAALARETRAAEAAP